MAPAPMAFCSGFLFCVAFIWGRAKGWPPNCCVSWPSPHVPDLWGLVVWSPAEPVSKCSRGQAISRLDQPFWSGGQSGPVRHVLMVRDQQRAVRRLRSWRPAGWEQCCALWTVVLNELQPPGLTGPGPAWVTAMTLPCSPAPPARVCQCVNRVVQAPAIRWCAGLEGEGRLLWRPRRRPRCERRWALTQPAAPARAGAQRACQSLPTGANSHCTKIGAGVLLWPGGGDLVATRQPGSLGTRDAQDVPGVAWFSLWEQNSQDYLAAGRWVDSVFAGHRFSAPLELPQPGRERPTSLGQPSLLFGRSRFLPLPSGPSSASQTQTLSGK